MNTPSTDFASIVADRSSMQDLASRFAEWFAEQPRTQFLLVDLARDLGADFSVLELFEFVDLLVERGIFKIKYRVVDNDGSLVGRSYDARNDIPDFAEDRSGFGFPVHKQNVKLMAVTNG